MEENLKTLKQAISLAIGKTTSPRSSSVALSLSGNSYLAGSIDAENKLLGISSEQGSLAAAVLAQDYKVYKIITLVENQEPGVLLSPIVAKIIIDHSTRTGQKINYSLINSKGSILFQTEDLRNDFKGYQPTENILTKVKENIPISQNWTLLPENYDLEKILKEYAILGLARNFPTYDTASGYSTAVITQEGKIYFGGQYSSPDQRLGLHSEVNVISSVLRQSSSPITHLGLVSSKFTETPCNLCGCCRQFIAEISSKYNWDLEIFCFAKDTNSFTRQKISEYLPNSWSSQKQ